MRIFVMVVGLGLAACGGDDGQMTMVDARPMTVDHDLSCLNYMPASVPTLITLDSIAYDFSTFPNPPPIANATAHVKSLDGTTDIVSGTSDMDGKFQLMVPTSGQATRFMYQVDAAGFPKTHIHVTYGPFRDLVDPDRAIFPAVNQARIDAFATALGATLDPAKGTLEVFMIDCSGSDYYAATPSVTEEPDLKWAMNGGANAWLPRTTTLHHPNNRGESIAAAANLTPGMKNFVLKDSTTTIGPIPFTIEADTHTILVVTPGWPKN